MTNPLAKKWSELDDNLRADGINLGWIGCDDPITKAAGRTWNTGGFMAGGQGAIITGPVRGMVHVPFKGIWHEPAYGPPRFERTVDERREISTRIALMSDSKFGWFNTEAKWWNGMTGDTPGFWTIFTRKFGQYYLPMQLLDAVETPLEDDPTAHGNNMQEWDILLAADGEPRWRTPDLKTDPWVNHFARTTTIKTGDSLTSPTITVGVGTFDIANRGTRAEWPIVTVTAPGRCWISNGPTNEMIRVPKLNKGEHIVVDTDPSHRIAISALDPVDAWTKRIIKNPDLLEWLLGKKTPTGTILERFHGQGFSNPIEPGTVGRITVFHSEEGAKVSVRIPQRWERAIS